jgi:hypothetical protein
LWRGKHGLVAHDDVEAGGLRLRATVEPGRPSADHDGVGRAHLAVQLGRVQAVSAAARAKVSWKSWR